VVKKKDKIFRNLLYKRLLRTTTTT